MTSMDLYLEKAIANTHKTGMLGIEHLLFYPVQFDRWYEALHTERLLINEQMRRRKHPLLPRFRSQPP